MKLKGFGGSMVRKICIVEYWCDLIIDHSGYIRFNLKVYEHRMPN